MQCVQANVFTYRPNYVVREVQVNKRKNINITTFTRI